MIIEAEIYIQKTVRKGNKRETKEKDQEKQKKQRQKIAKESLREKK